MKKGFRFLIFSTILTLVSHHANSWMYCCWKTPLYGLGYIEQQWCWSCMPGIELDGCNLCTPFQYGGFTEYYYGVMTYSGLTSGTTAKGNCCGFPA